MPTIRVGDIDLYYERHGEARGKDPVLLVMGLGMDSGAWELTTPVIAKTHEVIVFDNRGVGRSSKPKGPYTTKQMAADALGLLDALSIARAHVIGVSMGGMIAQELALAAPERVRSLCLMATYLKPDAEIERTGEAGTREILGEGAAGKPRFDLASIGRMTEGSDSAEAVPQIDPVMAMKFLMPLVFSKGYLEREKEALRARFSRLMSYGFEPHGFLAQVSATRTHDTIERISQLEKLPVMVMLGTQDRLIPPRLTRVIATAISNAKLHEVEGGTHGLMLEFAEPVNQALAAWVSDND